MQLVFLIFQYTDCCYIFSIAYHTEPYRKIGFFQDINDDTNYISGLFGRHHDFKNILSPIQLRLAELHAIFCFIRSKPSIGMNKLKFFLLWIRNIHLIAFKEIRPLGFSVKKGSCPFCIQHKFITPQKYTTPALYIR